MITFASAFQAIFLGLIQGLTEFIPVSSSGHLEIVPALFGWNKPSTILILFAHLGTLVALIIFFRSDLWQYVQTLWTVIRRQPEAKKQHHQQNLKLIRNVAIATIPAAIIGVLINKFASFYNNFYDSGQYTQLAQLVTLIAMALVGFIFTISSDWFRSKKVPSEKLSWIKALLIGIAQVAAFIRGVSRSGITLLTGQAVGMSRVEAAKFTFLMSIPLIAATSVYGIYELTKLPPEQMHVELPYAILTMVSSGVFGWLAIRYLLDYLKNNSLQVFGWYRIAFALVAALLLFT